MNRTIRIALAIQCLTIGMLASLVAFVAVNDRVEVTDTHGQTGLLWSLNSDPTAAGGVQAPVWQLLVRTDVPSMYYKSGTAATAWTLLGSSAAGAGTVTSVACGTNLSCAPSPITTTGTVATVAAPTFSGTVTGGNFTTGGNVTAAAGIVTGGQVVSSGLATLNTALVGDSGTDGVLSFMRSGAASSSVRTVGADPNGIVSALAGSLALDSNGKLWVNTTGAMVWVQLAVAGGGSAFYDTVLTPAALGGTTNDWNPGALGQNTLIRYDGGANNLTGLVGGVDGKIVTLQAKSGTAQASIQNDDAGSTAANRFLTSSGAPTSINVQGAHTFIYVGAESRWHIVSTGVI